MSRRLQIAMARLYTEPGIRQALYRGDTAALDTTGLSPGEVAALRRFACDNRERLEVYTAILVKKKSAYPRKRLPLLAAALNAVVEDGWDQTWSRYHAFIAGRAQPTVREGEDGLLTFVERAAASFGTGESLVRDAVRYERRKIEIGGATATPSLGIGVLPGCPWIVRPFVVEDFSHDLLLLAGGGGATALRRQGTKVLFCRHQTQNMVVTARVTAAIVKLLKACDGLTTRAELARVGGDGTAEVAETTLGRALDGLMKSGVLGVRRGEEVANG